MNASPGKANPRADGTNPRAVARRQAEAEAANRSTASAAALGVLAADDREHWEMLHPSLALAVGNSELAAAHVADLHPAGVSGGVLVVDGTPTALGWMRARGGRVLEACCASVGVEARLATPDEHEGLLRVIA